MSFFALGVNHQTASVELRERIAFNPERLKDLLIAQNSHPATAQNHFDIVCYILWVIPQAKLLA